MIPITCEKCGNEMDVQGALLFGPPAARRTLKMHICVKCWPLVWGFVRGRASDS